MALSDAAGGVNNAIQQILARRMQERAMAQRQQALDQENTARMRGLDEQKAYREMQMQDRVDAREEATAARRYGLAKDLGDQIPAGAELDPEDPAVAMMQEGGRGGLLRPQNTLGSTQMSGAMPLAGAEGTGVIRTTSSAPQLRGFLKTPSQSQAATATDDARQSQAESRAMAAEDRQSAAQRSAEEHQRVMERIAGQNAGSQAEARGLAAENARIKMEAEREKLTAARAEKETAATSAQQLTESALGLTKRLKTHSGIGAATGAYELRGNTQGAVDFNAIRDQLVAALALPNLGALKGPMSDKDILFVKQLATRLSNPRLSEPETRKAITEAERFLSSKLSTSPRVPGLEKGIRILSVEEVQ